MKKLYLFNSLSKNKELFNPLNEQNITMYVCGPTVYQRLHVGNLRSVVFYDVLFRLLLKIYPKVTYIRNITDVDDKIINNAKARFSNEEIYTKEDLLDVMNGMIKDNISLFTKDCRYLQCLDPTYQPLATDNINTMTDMINLLIANGFAYQKDNHVMFSVNKFKEYGNLSNRKLQDMISGSRIKVEEYKESDYDFILWKPSTKKEIGWDSDFGYGRPGWHIECSAMAERYLGKSFDIHGGGVDLVFPHHENEIAQTKCCYGNGSSAKYWVHNGILKYNNKKMSKSLGNIITLNGDIDGCLMRYILLSAHYRKPLEYSDHLVLSKTKEWNNLHKLLEAYSEEDEEDVTIESISGIDHLLNDVNTVAYFSNLNKLANEAKKSKDAITKKEMLKNLYRSMDFLGVLKRDK